MALVSAAEICDLTRSESSTAGFGLPEPPLGGVESAESNSASQVQSILNNLSEEAGFF